MAVTDIIIPAWQRRTGWALSVLIILFLVMDGGMKLVPLQPVIDTLKSLGYPPGLERGIGVLTLVCVGLYALPRTSVLGAILLTGLYGGAMATHLRAESPIFSHLLFGLYLGLLTWGGLYLRDRRVRALLPWSRA